jgi:hypothetical protein
MSGKAYRLKFTLSRFQTPVKISSLFYHDYIRGDKMVGARVTRRTHEKCIFFLFLRWDFGYCGRYWPIVPAPDDRWRWLWRNWWNEDWQGKPKYSEKTCSSATFVHQEIPHDQTRAAAKCEDHIVIHFASQGLAEQPTVLQCYVS